MARIVVVGGGIGGLSAALLLGRAGHHVTVCERDPAPTPLAPTMRGRRGRGLVLHRHGSGIRSLAGFQRELRQRLPDVLDAVLAAGAPELDMTMWMADGVERVPQDSELSMVRARRPVVEAVLRRAAEAEPTVQVRAGCRVQGLLADPPRPRDVPRVTGVATSGGAITADVVIVSGGRSVPVARWFNAIGATAPANRRKAADRPATPVTSRMLGADDDGWANRQGADHPPRSRVPPV